MLVGYPDSKVHGDHMGPTWGQQDPGWSHVDHVNLVIWDIAFFLNAKYIKKIDHDEIIAHDVYNTRMAET